MQLKGYYNDNIYLRKGKKMQQIKIARSVS